VTKNINDSQEFLSEELVMKQQFLCNKSHWSMMLCTRSWLALQVCLAIDKSKLCFRL